MNNIFKHIKFKNILECDRKWDNFINKFNKDCNIYYQWIEPKLSDFELFLYFQKELLIHQTKVYKKINITLNDQIPDEISSGIVIILDNVLLYVETDEEFKPIQDQTNNINKTISKLSNSKFLENVSSEIVELEKKKLIDFKNLQEQKLINSYFNQFGMDFINLILKFHSLEKIYWHLQYYREKNTILEEYSKEWYDYVYHTDIKQIEIKHLLNL